MRRPGSSCGAAWSAGLTGRAFSWCITRQADGALLGMLALRIDRFRADLGYVLARPAWGAGYASEAVRVLVDWALAQPQLHRVWAVCDAENRASARVLEKVGMQREGLLRRWILHLNLSATPHACWCYARVREEAPSPARMP